MGTIRKPAVAGQFYSGSKDTLTKEVESLIGAARKKEEAIGVVSPHAGYVYSGPVAGSVFGSIKPRSTYIIMGPNHTGMGEAFGLDTNVTWKTPIGDVSLNERLSAEIKKNSKHIREDNLSHLAEHSIEVQLPFLQLLQKDFTFVPIVVSYASLEIYREIGNDIARSVKNLKLEKDIMIIASSDMTHYESHEVAKKKDSIAIEAILELDEEKLVEAITKFDISMCGWAPTAIMLVAAKSLGAKRARLVRYQTSGDAFGDYSSVVGYAGIVVT